MARRQILARIGAGASTMGALVWVFWPTDWSVVLQPEPLFAFVVALCVWVSTEIFNGENYSTAAPPESDNDQRPPLTENDIRCSQQLLSYHRHAMRELLKDQDLGAYFDYRYVRELHAFVHANDEDHFEFLNRELDVEWRQVARLFKEFGRFMSANSTPDLSGNREVVRLDYHRIALMVEGAEDKPAKSEIGNDLASDVWSAFDKFIVFLKENFPETTNKREEEIWFYTKDA